MYVTTLSSPLGTLHLASDGTALTGLWITGQKYFASTLPLETIEKKDLSVFCQTEDWLRAYFAREPLPALPPLAPKGSPFRQAVWALLQPWYCFVTKHVTFCFPSVCLFCFCFSWDVISFFMCKTEGMNPYLPF